MDVNNDILEQLARAQAMYKALGELIGTRNPDNLRGLADAEIMRDWNAGKRTSLRLTIDDVKVGELVPKVAPEHTRGIVEDAGEMERWFSENPEIMHRLFLANRQKIVDWYVEKVLPETGEIPYGVTLYVEPEHIDGTKISINTAKVAEILGMPLQQAATKFLEGTVE